MPVRLREPKIEEVLSDPIVRLLMAHDGVEERELRRLINIVRLRLGGGDGPATDRRAAPCASAELNARELVHRSRIWD